jgi:hypothetical protein
MARVCEKSTTFGGHTARKSCDPHEKENTVETLKQPGPVTTHKEDQLQYGRGLTRMVF